MKNITSVRPKYLEMDCEDRLDTEYYSVTFAPLTSDEFTMYGNKKGYLVLSILSRKREIVKYFETCNIPYENTGKYTDTIKVKIKYFEKIENHENN